MAIDMFLVAMVAVAMNDTLALDAVSLTCALCVAPVEKKAFGKGCVLCAACCVHCCLRSCCTVGADKGMVNLLEHDKQLAHANTHSGFVFLPCVLQMCEEILGARADPHTPSPFPS